MKEYISKDKIKEIFDVKIHNFLYLSNTALDEEQKYMDEEIAHILKIILQELLEEKMTKKRKIIEIYVTEDEEDDTVSFNFERCENTEIANETMKGLCMMFAKWKDEEDKLEIEGEEKDG